MADASYDDALERYAAAVAGFPGLTVRGKANPYTSMNGNMFSFLDKTGVLCLRLSTADREEFVALHGTEPVVSYGAVMKEYVAVPDMLLRDPAALRAAIAASVAYAKTLKPKPTTRKK